MPPRSRAGATGLTAENLATLADAIEQGRRATVYLREAMPSLGLEAGTSAKVLSVDGNTVVISPKGVNDELPFEAEELTATRPKPAPTAATAASSSASNSSGDGAQPQVYQGIEPGPAPVKRSPATPKPDAAPKSDAAGAASTPPRKRAPAKKKAPTAVAVTIHAGADGEWSVVVTAGAKKHPKATPVSADAVERAVQELGDTATIEAVESVLAVARESAAARVEELSKQLEEARAALEALGAVG
ncbi:MAG: translation initiation factor [Rhodococcus sp.]|nr:translation initiation factor [Rhodococcus sp. (in: high G+C Gram-positive bacteria)]